jgi:hypothetical protein
MNDQPKRVYLYLDDVPERQHLIDEIAKVRQDVLRVIERVPEADYYTPRYHGWSLAAMLGHLNLVDQLSIRLIQAALLGFRPTVSLGMLNRSNDFMARVYRKRLVRTSLRSMERNEKRIAELIHHLPVGKFSKSVFHPGQQQYITIERALQDLFLYHWHDHLRTMHEVEGIQPSARSE